MTQEETATNNELPTERISLDEFIEKYKVKIKAVSWFENPHMEDGGGHMYNYKVRLKCGKRKMDLYYSKGQALSEKPTAKEVLRCLANDVAGYENAGGSFGAWCDEYGYDTDSMKAYKTWKAIVHQAHKLVGLLGDDGYPELLWDVDCD